MEFVTTFAKAEAASGGVFEALGIDWTTLVLQIIAFLILVWLLGKYAYPVLIKVVDERQASIDAGAKAADEAKEKAEKAKTDVDALLKDARKQASEIVATAKEEANAAIEAAGAKAKTHAEAVVAQAHEQIEKDVIAAKKTLHNETLDLVALATKNVIGNVVDAEIDRKIIESATSDAKTKKARA